MFPENPSIHPEPMHKLTTAIIIPEKDLYWRHWKEDGKTPATAFEIQHPAVKLQTYLTNRAHRKFLNAKLILWNIFMLNKMQPRVKNRSHYPPPDFSETATDSRKLR